MEIPKKTADYYRDFKEVNVALLLNSDEKNYPLVDYISLEILLTLENNEPKTFKQAIKGPYNKEWLEAMGQEVKELEDQECWELVDLP